MEEIRRAAEAYYENLSDEKKRNARFSFNEMDKNGDGKINLDEYAEYLKKDNTVLTHPSLFTALDKDGNGSLDFKETIVLYYIMQSGRALFCQSCNTFLADKRRNVLENIGKIVAVTSVADGFGCSIM
ncbi:hypothetical protein POTOM_058996 [Populus tomentosa]|uniref:EF-hand domain-containing protein n=1 Tax=Populus tomentosa TaxID=118781 RepID=A0A8X7XUP8_POPTO|nr:hypothetical protein POTOM_058996 [Populus tomentosa]